ncbi:carboxylesterase family protein [Ramlibacter sp. USB13]|uniref:Carboxylesterase family protein n=1 Tax=Ramlibacter cellulosilyticus TaxID=2764187 RepID=A0A923MRM7_9BURK|nr:carboxylesterase family protein [Ramlibacter cellulosilyticus]MBC5783696.1 carboxylesterase family protein [Ramlibacter cellulosilyticus]
MAGSSYATLTTHAGALRGRRSDDGAVFLGIPFAAPPVGALRWRAPQPVQAWTGLRDALAFGPDFPQAPDPHFRAGRQDEDCLYLNVWTPTLAAGAKLPVLVWFFGGGFSSGSGSDVRTDGARLAAEGAVVVSVNYRCGLFGFLAHPALSAESEHGVSGNYGLLDQVAALAWVRDNIAAFGGDPERVTPFGYSAGAASLSLLLTSQAARGLFQGAILQSPGAARPLAGLQDAERAGMALGIDLAALRALAGAEVLARTSLLMPAVRGLTTPRVLRPVRDGWLLREDERSAFHAGRFEALPLLVGSNVDEGSLLTRAWPVDTVAAWRQQVEANFGAAADEAASLYPARSDAEARGAVAAMFADTQFNYGTRLLAQSMAPREPRTWKYLFTRRRPGQQDGPHHGDEVGHVFGTLEASGPGRHDAVDTALSAAMRKAWVAFAATGDPNTAGAPRWEPYRPAADNHLVLGDAAQPGAAWRRPQLDFLERFFG